MITLKRFSQRLPKRFCFVRTCLYSNDAVESNSTSSSHSRQQRAADNSKKDFFESNNSLAEKSNTDKLHFVLLNGPVGSGKSDIMYRLSKQDYHILAPTNMVDLVLSKLSSNKQQLASLSDTERQELIDAASRQRLAEIQELVGRIDVTRRRTRKENTIFVANFPLVVDSISTLLKSNNNQLDITHNNNNNNNNTNNNSETRYRKGADDDNPKHRSFFEQQKAEINEFFARHSPHAANVSLVRLHADPLVNVRRRMGRLFDLQIAPLKAQVRSLLFDEENHERQQLIERAYLHADQLGFFDNTINSTSTKQAVAQTVIKLDIGNDLLAQLKQMKN